MHAYDNKRLVTDLDKVLRKIGCRDYLAQRIFFSRNEQRIGAAIVALVPSDVRNSREQLWKAKHRPANACFAGLGQASVG